MLVKWLGMITYLAEQTIYVELLNCNLILVAVQTIYVEMLNCNLILVICYFIIR